MSKRISRRRRNSAIIAVILAVALVLTGTLAWQAISQKALNNVAGEITPAGARLHDDFALADEPDFTQPLNKDVYVENYSGQNPKNAADTGEPVYVRVQLKEYMEMGPGAGLFSLSGDDPSDYQTLDQVDANGTRIADSNNEAVSLVAGGSILDLKTWRTHVEEEASNPFAPYWSWTMGGSKVFMPTFNKDNTSLLTDRTDYAQNKFTAGDTQTAGAGYASALYDNQSETHTAKDTLTTAGIVSMTEWKALGSPMEKDGLGYWVGDSDGWYYWSKGLDPGEATALLLDTIALTGTLEGEFYYGIHVTSQMATAGDWGSEADETGFYEGGLTEDGRDLLDQAAGLKPTYEVILTQVDGTGNGTANTVDQEGTIRYTAAVKITDPVAGITVDADDQTVKWELIGTHKPGTTIANTDGTSDEYTSGGVTLTVAADETVGTDLLTIRVTSKEGAAVQTVNVSIAEKKPSSPAANVPDGGKFTDNKGIQWQVLKTDQDGNKLVLTVNRYSSVQYNTTNVWKVYKESNIMTHATQGLSYFYTNSIGSDVRAVAMPVTIEDKRTAVNNPIPYDAAETLDDDLSEAGSGVATAINAPFVLSISEYNKYRDNIEFLGSGWVLRTPGYEAAKPVTGVISDGTVVYSTANTTNLYRLALWLRS